MGERHMAFQRSTDRKLLPGVNAPRSNLGALQFS